jgi:hypothetical protein
MADENGKALRLLELYRERGDLPVGPQRLLYVDDLFGMSGFVQLEKLMQVGAKCMGRALRRRGQGFRHNQVSFGFFKPQTIRANDAFASLFRAIAQRY